MSLNFKRHKIALLGWAAAPFPVLLLFFVSPAAWLVCPYSLCVMFLLYANHGITTLVVPGPIEFVVGFLQFPIYGFLISRAFHKGSIKQTCNKILLWHIIAIGVALLSLKFLDYVWHARV